MQTEWRWCNKCQGLAFSLNQPSVCPAGGSHDHAGSGNYALALDDPSAQGQSEWRWCRKCQGLAFSQGQPSVCPAGGSHDHSQSGNYTLRHNDPSAPGQSEWRWCRKCQGLAFSRNQPSVCPAGGSHDHAGSGNYILAFGPATGAEEDFEEPYSFVELSGSVGQNGQNKPEDVTLVQTLLNAVPVDRGGPSQQLTVDGKSGAKTVGAIRGFQSKHFGWNLADGRVDLMGPTWQMLTNIISQIAPELLQVGTDTGSGAGMAIRQANPPELASVHSCTNPVVSPLSIGNKFQEFDLTTMLSEFLFELKKGSSTFWVGAAVPVGTVDFTRVQIFFHPTVVQAGTVHASDADYKAFKGGWSGSIQRYVSMEGGQLAGARLMPLIVPFTTMGALNTPARNMFSDRPVETLNAIVAAIANEITGNADEQAPLAQIGVSSFSSGISALRLFLKHMSSSDLVKEVIDFDSPYIVNEPKKLTRFPGAVSKCYTQHVLPSPPAGWVNLPAQNFSQIHSYRIAHSIIGWMTYYMAMLTSTIL